MLNEGFDISREAILEEGIIRGYIIKLKDSSVEHVVNILNILRKYRVNLVYIAASTGQLRDGYSLIIYGDFTLSEVEPCDLKKKLLEVENVVDVFEIEPIINNLLMDTYSSEIKWRTERALVFREKVLKAILKNALKKFGPAFLTFAYHVGYILGKSSYYEDVELVKSMGGRRKDLIKYALVLFQSTGGGKAEIVSIDYSKSTIVMKISSIFEYDIIKEVRGKEPYTYITRGTWAGWFSGLFDKEMVAEEIKCTIETDGKPVCYMVIKPK